MSKIEMGRVYRTRDGREVRIYAVDGGSEFCIHGAVCVNGLWEMVRWTKDGASWTTTKNMPFDLIEVRPRIQREVWVNVYAGAVMGCYNSKAGADGAAGDGGRIACVKLVIDCEEGHGLD